MTDRIVETIRSPKDHQRVIIVQRPDGKYSFRKQFPEDKNYKGPGVFVWPEEYPQEDGWLPPGPQLGIYDSAETAKWEALCKVEWLKSVLNQT